jgi:hypothetical protein
MAAEATKSGEENAREKETRVSIPAPLSPGKPAFVKLVGTLNTLWGADRVLRTGQFLGRLLGGSPEVNGLVLALSECIVGLVR